jgi:hypothetical protein
VRYIVDGYNVTMADDATRRLSRDDQRDALVRRLSVRGEDLLGPGPITVVFDGQHGSAALGSAHVTVRHSSGESADDVIVRMAANAEDALVVVTSDRELRDRVREVASGPVEFKGCSSLFSERMRRTPRRRARGRFPASTAGLPAGANRITEELKGIWLAGDGSDEAGQPSDETGD